MDEVKEGSNSDNEEGGYEYGTFCINDGVEDVALPEMFADSEEWEKKLFALENGATDMSDDPAFNRYKKLRPKIRNSLFNPKPAALSLSAFSNMPPRAKPESKALSPHLTNSSPNPQTQPVSSDDPIEDSPPHSPVQKVPVNPYSTPSAVPCSPDVLSSPGTSKWQPPSPSVDEIKEFAPPLTKTEVSSPEMKRPDLLQTSIPSFHLSTVDGVDHFNVYMISCRYHNFKWVVFRRYSEFLSIYYDVVKLAPEINKRIVFPGKTLLPLRHKYEFLKERKRQLHLWLAEASSFNNVVQLSQNFRKFLDLHHFFDKGSLKISEHLTHEINIHFQLQSLLVPIDMSKKLDTNREPLVEIYYNYDLLPDLKSGAKCITKNAKRNKERHCFELDVAFDCGRYLPVLFICYDIDNDGVKRGEIGRFISTVDELKSHPEGSPIYLLKPEEIWNSTISTFGRVLVSCIEA